MKELLNNPEVVSALKTAVKEAIAEANVKGFKTTDSDMFKYTKAYTGDFWIKQEERLRKNAA